MSGSGSYTFPGMQSFKMRRQEITRHIEDPAFVCWASCLWRSKTALATLLGDVFTAVELRGLSSTEKIAKLYGYDGDSMFSQLPHLEEVLKQWGKYAQL